MQQEYFWNLIAKKLSGEASKEELQELEKALRQNPDLHYSMQTLIDLWKPALPDHRSQAEQAFNRHLSRLQEVDSSFDVHGLYSSETPAFDNNNSKSKGKKIWLASAGIIILLTGLIWYGGFFHKSAAAVVASTDPSPKNSIIYTRNGSKTNVVLPDGTQVWLNAGSELTYDKQYGNALREVNLKGEAFFDVVKNKEKPFVIHTGKINIRVLGTAFNVKSYPGEKTIETSLIRGSIEVTFKDRPSEKVILKPNEKLVVANEEFSVIGAKRKELKKENEPIVSISHISYARIDSTVIETAWIHNKLAFQDESFYDLARKMEHWYGVSITFTDPDLDTLHFTGSFESETIQQALNALQVSAHFKYVSEDNQIIISK